MQISPKQNQINSISQNYKIRNQFYKRNLNLAMPLQQSGNICYKQEKKSFFLKKREGVPISAQWLTNLTSIHEDAVQSWALISGLRVRCCCELWCREQTQLRSHAAVAVVQATSYISDLTPSLGTAICCGCGP